MPKVDSDLWWRAHSHPMAPAGPPPPVTTDLMRVGRQLLIQDVRPGKRPATGSESSPTSSRQGTVHDVIRAAVARAQSFAPARVEAFGRVLAEANWQTIDRLSESSQVSPVPPRARPPTARAIAAPFSFAFSRLFPGRPWTRADRPVMTPADDRVHATRPHQTQGKMVIWSPDDDDLSPEGIPVTPAEAAAKMLFGADEAPRMVSALTAGLAATEQKHAHGHTNHAHVATPSKNRRRTSLDGDDRPAPPRLARHASFTSWDWNGSGGAASQSEGCVESSAAVERGAPDHGALGLPRRGRRQHGASALPTIQASPGAVAKRRRVSEGEVAENDSPRAAAPVVASIAPTKPSSPIVISAKKQSPPRQRVGADMDMNVDTDEEYPGGAVREPTHVELARARDRAEEEAERVRLAKRDGESDTMKALRRQWETMKGRPMSTSSSLPTHGRPKSGRENDRTGDGDTPPPKMVRRRAPNLKQRLNDIVIPVLNPARNWQFNTRVTGLNLSNASIGPEGAKFLASALHGRRNADGAWVFNGVLRSLTLEFNSIGDEGAVCIFEALAPRWVTDGPDEISASDVSGHSGFDQDEWMHSTAQAAQPARTDGKWVCNTAMQELNLNFCDIGPAGAAALARALAPRVGPEGGWVYCSGITSVSLFHNHIGPEGARLLGDALAPRRQPATGEHVFNPVFKALNVGRNQLGDQGLAHIARAFSPKRSASGHWDFNPTFVHLHANQNSCMVGEGPLAVGAALTPRPNPDGGWAFAHSLSTLHLANVQLDEEGGRAIAAIIAPRQNASTGVWVFPSNLRVLNLSRTGLGDAGAVHVAEALLPRWSPLAQLGTGGACGRWLFNPRLRELHLGGATIGPGGAKALARALTPQRNNDFFADVKIESQWAFNTALRILDLRDNQIGADGMEAIAAMLEPVPVEVDFGTQSPNSGSSTPGAFNANAFFAHGGAQGNVQGPNSRGGSARGSDRRTRWVPGGGGLAVLNLEFNDAGPEGICAVAKALTPRWCAGPVPGLESGRSSPVTTIDAYPPGLSMNSGGSPNSSAASSPGATPYGSRPSSARGRGGFINPRSRPNSGRAVSRPSSAGPSQTASRRSSFGVAVANGLAVPTVVDELVCTGVGGDDCACGTCQGVWTQQPVAAPLGEGYWVANRALRGLAVGGNRMGDEGAAALAQVIEPRMNSDGSWTCTALHAVDAKENGIGTEGLLALARAVEPRCGRCLRGRTSRLNSTDSLVSMDTECRSVSRPGSTHGASLLSSVLLNNAASAAANAAGDVAGLMNSWGIGGNSPADTPRSFSPTSDGTGDRTPFSGTSPRVGSPTGECAFEIHSAVRRLDLLHNDTSADLKAVFQQLKTTGSQCDVTI